MANLQELTRQMMSYGNTYANADSSKSKKSEWEKLLSQMLAAQKMDSRTMAGFALGKLLRGGYDTWLENYKDRGDRKAQQALGGNGGGTDGLDAALGRAGYTPQSTEGAVGGGIGAAAPSLLGNTDEVDELLRRLSAGVR